ncbi:MAG: alpha/beta hydrolase [Nitrososphaeria archaeon]
MKELFVSFMSGGERVAGMLHVPEKTPAPAIIFCHGFTGHRIESHRLFVIAAREFCKRGFVVLRFDFRGSGESEGSFDSMTISREVEDLENALDWVHGRREVLAEGVGVVGLSLGGVVSLLTAAKDKRIKVVCTWSSPADLKTLEDNIKGVFGEMSLKKLLMKDFIDLPSGDRIGRGFLLDALGKNVLEAVARISPRPILIVHGTRDPIVPFSHSERLFGAAGEPKEKFDVEGADHTFNKWDWEWLVFNRTIDFFKKYLKSTM